MNNFHKSIIAVSVGIAVAGFSSANMQAPLKIACALSEMMFLETAGC